jgi:hypothetical protein
LTPNRESPMNPVTAAPTAADRHAVPTSDVRSRSRAEALRLALLGAEAMPDEAQVVAVRAGRWADVLQPKDDFQSWLVGQVAELSGRVDRCQQSERRLRERASLRAEVCWDADRKREAEAIGGKLADRPVESVDRLRGTAAGCDWLIRRWALLARAADQDAWTAEQSRLAFDLLATPEEFRTGPPGQGIDDQGRVIHQVEEAAAIARRQIADLRDRRDRLADLDEVDRALVIAGLFDDSSPEIRRLQRYEASLHRRIGWCLAQLGKAPAGSPPRPEPRPGRLPEVPTPGPGRARPSLPTLEPGPGERPEPEIDLAQLQETRRETRRLLAEFRNDPASWLGQAGA